MVEIRAVIKNAMGIHCRPSAIIVKEAREFSGSLEVVAPEGRCDPRSILDLISLCLTEGTTVTLRVSGRDETNFAQKLSELFERRFDFPPRECSA